jgi:cytochrome P450
VSALPASAVKGFDPNDPDLVADPYPAFRALREGDPIHWSPLGYWVASRYDDVRRVLMDRSGFGQGDFISNIRMFYEPGFDVLGQSAYRWLSEVFVMQDPPNHTRLRGLVTQALNARRVAAMRPRIQEIADTLIDEIAGAGGAEMIHEFAYRLPTLVMCDMLGIERDEAALAKLNQAIADSFIVFEARRLSDAELSLANRQIDYLGSFFEPLFDARRANPRDDLTTALVNASDGSGSLSNHELTTVVVGLFGAGFETTAHMIGNGLLTLNRFPDQWARLCADPDGLGLSTAEEVLRYESSLIATYRTALQDTEVAGVAVAKGQRVLTLLGAANRDPAAFDHPDAFDIGRSVGKHLSFGGGIHFCVGAELARLEGQIAFSTLARRLPAMRVDTGNPTWRPGFLFRGLSTLNASW